MFKNFTLDNNDFLYLYDEPIAKKELESLIKQKITFDSSTMLYDLKCFDNFEYTEIIIPITSFQELSGLKGEINTERGFFARTIIDFLNTLTQLRGEGLKNGLVYGTNIIRLHYLGKLTKDSPLHDLHEVDADKIIIETARVTNSKLCSRDKEMNIIALDFVELYPYEFDIIPREIYKGYRYIPVALEDYTRKDSLFSILRDERILQGNPLNMYPWEFGLFVDKEEYETYLKTSKQRGKKKQELQILFTTVYQPKNSKAANGDLRLINLDDYSRGYKVNALNQEQKMLLYLMKQMKNKNIHLLSIEGGAGRGKTLQTVDLALESVIRDRDYTKMLYTKSIREIDKQEQLGTLPGDEFEKFKNYVLPFYSAIEYIHRHDIHGKDTDERTQKNRENGVISRNQKEATKSLKSVDEIVEEYRATNKLLFLPLGKVRGMNIYNGFGMLDEGQNTTRHGMKSYISRFDNTSSVIVMGDNQQIDDPALNAHNNGFSHLIEEGKSEPYVAHITLDIDADAMRGLLATFASNKL